MSSLAPSRILLLALLTAGCADQTHVYSPVGNVRYSALGHDPFWIATIGDDRIVLTFGDSGGRADGPLESYAFPRTLPRIEGVNRIWESADGTAAITIVARRGPCTGSRGRVYQDHVRVRLSGRELQGCGGRVLSEAAV